jgi:hypothetical protein
MPRKFQNAKKGNVGPTKPIIPLRLKRNMMVALDDKESIIEDIFNGLTRNDGRVKNKNSDKHLKEITEKYIRNFYGDKSKFKPHYLDKDNKVIGEQLAKDIVDAYENGEAKRFGSGAGIDAEGTEINIWIMKNVPGYDNDYIYITAYVASEIIDYVPATTGKEVFANKLEDNTSIIGNGAFVIPLRCETASNIDDMYIDIEDLIDISIKKPVCSKKISSCFDNEDKEYKGILVTQDVYEALKPGGSIAEKIKKKFGYDLILEKSRGQLSKEIKEKGYLKLASISW